MDTYTYLDNTTYTEILDNIPSAMFIISRDFKVVYYNKTFKNIFAPNSDKPLVGNTINCSLLLQDESCGQGRFCHKCVLNRLLKNAVVKGRRVYREVIEKDVYSGGEEKTLKLRLSIQPIHDNQLFVCTMDDISEAEKGDFELLRRQVNKDLKRAKKIQSNFLPKDDALSPLADFKYIYKQHHQVGGDFFDLFKLSDSEICGYIADVSGAGLAGGMLTVFLHNNYQPSRSPAESLEALSRKFNSYNFPDESYITMLAFYADTKDRKLLLCNAGHNMPALLIKPDRVSATDQNGRTISGWYAGAQNVYSNCELSYDAGDKLVLMTDGIADMKNHKREEVTYERILNFCNVNSRTDIEDFIKLMTKEIRRFLSGGENLSNDDYTLLAVQL